MLYLKKLLNKLALFIRNTYKKYVFRLNCKNTDSTPKVEIEIAIIENKIKDFEKKHGPLTNKQKRYIMANVNREKRR